MTSMSFHEKSAWGTLISLLVIGALYASSVANLWRADQLHIPATFGLMVGFTILLVVVLTGYHILVAAVNGAQQEDERDQLIKWRAGHIGGFVLGFGVVTVIMHIVIGGMVGATFAQSPALIANGLLMALFVAAAAELTLTIWYYRRGV